MVKLYKTFWEECMTMSHTELGQAISLPEKTG